MKNDEKSKKVERLKEIIEEGDKVDNRGKDKIQSVIFIQHTLHSKLAQNIREKLKVIETVGQFKFKTVERTGNTLVDSRHVTQIECLG